MRLAIVSTAERLDLVPVVARSLWGAFAQGRGRSPEFMIDAVGEAATAPLMRRDLVQAA